MVCMVCVCEYVHGVCVGVHQELKVCTYRRWWVLVLHCRTGFKL